VSIVPGFESFIIESSGIGDISLSVSRPVWRREGKQLLANAGLSLPVGSIDEVGPTPRVPGTDTQLPFTMPIGSGTFDLTPSLTYAAGHNHWNWGSQLRGTFRIGENDRDYTLGNRLGLSAWVKRTSSSWVSPSLRFVLQSWGRIDGEDDELKVGEPGAPFRFPAAVTDPDKFGGEKLTVVFAATLRDPRGLLERHSIELEWGLPTYQSLNGPQPKEQWRFAAGWHWSF
jgi:hypothetical protein